MIIHTMYKPATHSKKLGHRHVYHCVTLPFLELRVLIVAVLQVEYLPIITGDKTSATQQCVVIDSSFIMCHTFSVGDRSELQAG